MDTYNATNEFPSKTSFSGIVPGSYYNTVFFVKCNNNQIFPARYFRIIKWKILVKEGFCTMFATIYLHRIYSYIKFAICENIIIP